MSVFQAVAVLVSLVALFTYLNRRLLRLPTPIGVMVMALGLSLLLVALGPVTGGWAERFATNLEFGSLLLDGMLGFLLFASALQLDARALTKRKWSVLLLATLSTALSTFLVGVFAYYALQLFGLTLPFVYALVFGALISPTDPVAVAVAGLLDEAGLPEALRTIITGESLFNDGVGIVLFSVLLGLTGAQADASVSAVAFDFLREAGGGILLGLVLGYAATRMIERGDDFTVTVLLTLAIVTGGYALASVLGISGPITMAAAGLLIGNGLQTKPTHKYLAAYWNITEDLLNASLFVLIGLELLVLPFSRDALVAAAVAILLVLLARFLSVSLALIPVRLFVSIPANIRGLFTWAALRGGIAIALALAIPAGQERDLILVMTYGVVLFSVLVQGLTIKRVAARLTETET